MPAQCVFHRCCSTIEGLGECIEDCRDDPKTWAMKEVSCGRMDASELQRMYMPECMQDCDASALNSAASCEGCFEHVGRGNAEFASMAECTGYAVVLGRCGMAVATVGDHEVDEFVRGVCVCVPDVAMPFDASAIALAIATSCPTWNWSRASRVGSTAWRKPRKL